MTRRLGAPGPLGDLRPGQARRGQQDDPGPLRNPGRNPLRPGPPRFRGNIKGDTRQTTSALQSS
jgi:hypothetical protein